MPLKLELILWGAALVLAGFLVWFWLTGQAPIF